MRNSRIVIASAAMAAVCLFAGTASAQAIHDHLKCYKVKDPSSFSALAALRPLNPSAFEVDADCQIKVRSRELCVPVAKELASSDAPHLDVSGVDLTNAFLCYKVRCQQPGNIPATIQMSDQFGTRTLSGLRTSTVCAPAIFGAPPVTTTTTTTLPDGIPRDCTNATPPNCDGTCNDFNLACVESSGACICEYHDVFGACPMLGHGAPACHGTCEGTQTCLDVGGGACACGLAYE